jgi:hypothetical protein
MGGFGFIGPSCYILGGRLNSQLMFVTVGARTTKKNVSILEGLATEILAVSETKGQRSTASWNLVEEIKSLARLDYGVPLRRTLGRREVMDIVAEARKMVWPNLNREPVRLVTPSEFTRLWSSLGVDFRLANFGGPQGLALMGFYARKMGRSRRPLIYVNTAHHPAAVGAAFTHEMGHHLTARIFASQKERAHYLTYTAYAAHLDDSAELAADSLVSLGIFPGDIAREIFEVESKPSKLAKSSEPAFARVRNYFRNRYGLNLDMRLPAHKKLPYLAGMIHYANLRRALLNEYDI